MVKLLDPTTGEAHTETEWMEEGKGEEVRNDFIEVREFEGGEE